MKTFFKISALLFTVILSVSLLGGCSGKIDASKDLDRIKESGELKVGMECNYAPYNWSQTTENEFTVKVSENMYADGYDVQIAKLVAEYLGVKLVIKPMEWSGLIPGLESGDIDMVIAGMSPTAERKLSIDFSDTYYDSNLVIVVRKDSEYASATKISDFKGAKMTGQLNSFHYTVIDQIEGVNKLTAVEDTSAIIQALAAGTIDGYVGEKPGAISAVTANSDFTFVEFAEGDGFKLNPEEASISVGVRKGSSLTAEINKAIAELTREQKEALMDAAIARQPVNDE